MIIKIQQILLAKNKYIIWNELRQPKMKAALSYYVGVYYTLLTSLIIKRLYLFDKSSWLTLSNGI